jgi:hypothetical protein
VTEFKARGRESRQRDFTARKPRRRMPLNESAPAAPNATQVAAVERARRSR